MVTCVSVAPVRQFLHRHLAVAATALLTACSPAKLLNATIPTFGVHVTHDVAYGIGPRHTLDIYRPVDAQGRLPVVVFFYGGSWNSGSKAEYLFVATALARRGLLVMVPDYRLYPDVRYPAFLTDCADAVAWAMRHAADYGGDPSNLFLMGHSAGAYNVAMLTLDRDFLAKAGIARDDIRAAVTLAGPFDFLPLTDPEVQAVFSSVADLAPTQPINHVDGQNPPMLLLQGGADDTVYPRNTTALAAKIRADGGPVEDKIYPGVRHIGIILSFAPWFRGIAPALSDSVAFIRAHIQSASMPYHASDNSTRSR
jgi:acetyl esterase/lipase